MDYEKLIKAVNLCGSTPKVEQCKKCAYWAGGDMSKCIPRMTTDAATALSTLQAENKAMQKQLNEFSEFLCRMTGGLLSKTNYTAQVMATISEDYQQKACRECNLQAENEQLRAELEQARESLDFARTKDAEIVRLGRELEQVKRERDDLERFLGELEGAVYTGQYFHLRPMLEKWRGQKED